MLFKEHLQSHGMGEEFFSPKGTLIRMDVEGLTCFIKPYQMKYRSLDSKVPLEEVFFPGLFVKFSEEFKAQTYKNMGSGEGLGIATTLVAYAVKLIDFIFRTKTATEPIFNGYIEGTTGNSKAFPFGVFLKVIFLKTHLARYEEPDGTLWEISHIPLADINWIEVSVEPSPCSD